VGTCDIPEPPPPPEVCFDGLSHGYWKTHTDTWNDSSEAEYLAENSCEKVFGIEAHADWYVPGSKGTTTK
jgi:hypothetical protein